MGAMLLLHTLILYAAPSTDTLRLAMVGDLLLDRGVRAVVERHGMDALFHRDMDSIFHRCHIVIANLECPATSIRQPINKKYIFRAEPAWLFALRRHGITHLNMANNHVMDQGRKGMVDTRYNIRKAGMISVGMGNNAEEACRPLLLSRSPRPVYILSSQFVKSENWSYLPDEPSVCECREDALVERIQKIKKQSSHAYVIVMLHWGAEHRKRPEIIQRFQAHKLIDGGADCIVGHHSHTTQSIERYRGKPIYYSLGNFIFDQHRPLNSRALLLRLDITASRVHDYAHSLQIKYCSPQLVR